MLAPDTIYLVDAGYAEYKLLNEIIAAGSSFVIRLRDNASYVVLEEKPLTESDHRKHAHNYLDGTKTYTYPLYPKRPISVAFFSAFRYNPSAKANYVPNSIGPTSIC